MIPMVLRFNWPTGRDSAVYANGFQDLLNGENPYSEGIFRSGLFGSIPFYLVARALPQSLEAAAFLSLGICGTALFLRYFTRRNNQISSLIILVVTIGSSANREALNNIQITGVILGLMILVTYSASELTKPNIKLGHLLLGSISMAIAIDLKPHLVLPLFLMLFSYRRYWLIVLSALSLWSLAHFLIDFISGKAWTLTWFRLMIDLATRPNTQDRSDFVNIWSIFSVLFGDSTILNLFPYLIIFSFIALCLIYKWTDINKIMFFAVFLSLLSTYSHYYDYVPLVALCINRIFNEKTNALHYGYLSFIMLSQNLGEISGLLIVMFTTLALVAVKSGINRVSSWRIEFMKLVLGLILFLAMHTVNNVLIGFGVQESSVSATLVLIISAIIIIRSLYKEKLQKSVQEENLGI
jgi:hypothetical protein